MCNLNSNGFATTKDFNQDLFYKGLPRLSPISKYHISMQLIIEILEIFLILL